MFCQQQLLQVMLQLQHRKKEMRLPLPLPASTLTHWQSIDRRKLVSIDQPLLLSRQPPPSPTSLSIRPLAIYKLNSVKLNYFICRQRVIDDGSSGGGSLAGNAEFVMTWFSSFLPIMASPRLHHHHRHSASQINNYRRWGKTDWTELRSGVDAAKNNKSNETAVTLFELHESFAFDVWKGRTSSHVWSSKIENKKEKTSITVYNHQHQHRQIGRQTTIDKESKRSKLLGIALVIEFSLTEWAKWIKEKERLC